MRKRGSLRRGWLVPGVFLVLTALVTSQPLHGQGSGAEPGEDLTKPPPNRVFALSRFSIDAILKRPYGPDIPFGGVGDRLWASSPQGWAFGEDVHFLYLTNLGALDLEIRDEFGTLQPAEATYSPSHVHLRGAERAAEATASFTYRGDRLQGPLRKPFRPEDRWTCWSSGQREDWYAVDFGGPRTISGLTVHFFDDTGQGSCRPPESLTIERWEEDRWQAIQVAEAKPDEPAPGENSFQFNEPVETDKIRLVFRNAGENFYTGLYGLEPRFEGETAEVSWQIEGDKFLTSDDILVSIVRIRNPSKEAQTIQVIPVPAWQGQQRFHLLSNRSPNREGPAGVWALEGEWQTRYHEIDVQERLRFHVVSDPPEPQEVREDLRILLADSTGPLDNAAWMRSTLPFTYEIGPGETRVFKAALEIKPADERTTIDRVLAPVPGIARGRLRAASDVPTLEANRQDLRDPLTEQVAEYEAWFNDNLAFFDCSDPWIRKLYYHRAYNLRKNMMDPRLGALKWPTQAEGRWRSTWYPNVISYGAAHQVRESRWLRDPKYWRGHLQTWAENQKADHVYPSHIKPSGPQSGQYTDWITSTAWSGHLVHPSRDFLAPLADKLADNVRGWQSVYDPDGDGLLQVDSHWWTGMEYQPSFFYFSDYRTSEDFWQPETQVTLDRVDLTSYNFGNAQAVARIYRLLDEPQKAKEFDDLASKIAGAVQSKMWQGDEQFFYSLRAEDGEVAKVKEIVGVYPFYFGMLPVGEGFEAAWASILDPEQFWTPWPVASASKECPAYSQDGWPQADGRRVACMWNGPTWPHANAIVLTAMARTLRSDRDLPGGSDKTPSPLTREKLWELFLSYTKAQFRGQDLAYPWTGEFYDGESGVWKTDERDYHHSTWLDVLIPDLIGLIPREDEILEIDPLLPDGALSHFLLDGLSYHGHDITIVWDQPDDFDQYDDGREGLDVYVDGKLVASSPELSRLQVDLKTGQAIAP